MNNDDSKLSIWQQYAEDLKSSAFPSTPDAGLPENLYHYTSAESCFSIIGQLAMSPQPRLWASCALGMNDAGEIRYGISLVHEVASEFVPKAELDRSFAKHYKHSDDFARLSYLETLCIACFCDKPDLLSQWRAYGKRATGYCIGFRRDLLSTAALEAGFRLVPITYEREVQMATIRKLFERATTIFRQDRPEPDWRFWRITIDVAEKLSLGFKHPSFSEEREWRLISSPNPGLNFRASPWGVVPYVEICLPRDSVASIWQGPTLDHDLTRRTLEMYLGRTYGVNSKGEPVVQIFKSEIPLRKLES